LPCYRCKSSLGDVAYRHSQHCQ